jgi:hypothetical protein
VYAPRVWALCRGSVRSLNAHTRVTFVPAHPEPCAGSTGRQGECRCGCRSASRRRKPLGVDVGLYEGRQRWRRTRPHGPRDVNGSTTPISHSTTQHRPAHHLRVFLQFLQQCEPIADSRHYTDNNQHPTFRVSPFTSCQPSPRLPSPSSTMPVCGHSLSLALVLDVRPWNQLLTTLVTSLS